jgi:DNA-binding transcriptional MerR regulator
LSNTSPTSQLVTISQAARILHVSAEWVRHLEASGELAAEGVGGMRVFRLADVTALAAKRAEHRDEIRSRR